MSDEIRDYYNAHAEQEHRRLDSAISRVEFCSTLRLIDKYFPAGGRVCDIGAATGRYTLELLRRGCAVTMVDLSDVELRLAGQELQRNGFAAEQAVVGDARELGMLASGSFDAALLLGPMYHIVDAAGRAQALGELRRVLKPGGVAIVAFLNSWGVIQTSITDCPEWFGDMDRMRRMLTKQPLGSIRLSEFTECYFSTPVSALAEVRAAGFEVMSYAGTESFTNGLSTALERVMREQPEAYANVVTLAAETCELPQYRDSADHLHVVGRRLE